MNNKGFTLIELMIVVLVIGILAAVGIPKYQSFVIESRQKSCMSQLKSIDQAIGVWETQKIAFPYDNIVGIQFRPDGWIYANQIWSAAAGWYATNGVLPANDEILRIAKDVRLFSCPEVVSKYAGVQNMGTNSTDWCITYRLMKLCPTNGTWTDWVPQRIGRAITCFTYGYNWNDGLVTGAWWGWRGPGNIIAPGWAGPDHTRATMHLQWNN